MCRTKMDACPFLLPCNNPSITSRKITMKPQCNHNHRRVEQRNPKQIILVCIHKPQSWRGPRRGIVAPRGPPQRVTPAQPPRSEHPPLPQPKLLESLYRVVGAGGYVSTAGWHEGGDDRAIKAKRCQCRPVDMRGVGVCG